MIALSPAYHNDYLRTEKKKKNNNNNNNNNHKKEKKKTWTKERTK